MTLQLNSEIGLVCRDFAFLADSQGGHRILEKKITNRHARKGNMRYAEMLIDEILIPHTACFDQAVVVGDGEGDIRFFLNLEARLVPQRKVAGLFIRNPAIERFHSEFPNAQFFKDWSSLADAIVGQGRADTKENTIFLVDVDRTVIFPRPQSDPEYYLNRNECVIDYVTSFRSDGIRAHFSHQINLIVETVSAHLREYADNQFNDVCFKNEEIVALGTLLCSLGAIDNGWMTRRPDPFPLKQLIDISIQAIRRGQWISRIDFLQSGGGEKNVSGESVWDSPKLLAHLESCQANLSESSLVVVPKFRDYESKRLSGLLRAQATTLINWPLIKALKCTLPHTVVFVSDRPARSLSVRATQGSRMNAATDVGAFWKIVTAEICNKA